MRDYGPLMIDPMVWKHDVIRKPEVHIAMPSEEDSATATVNMHKDVWWSLATQFSSYARGQTDRRVHYNILQFAITWEIKVFLNLVRKLETL